MAQTHSFKNRSFVHTGKPEWPTLGLFMGCYLLWAVSLGLFAVIGLWALPLTILTTAFHSSLQHEVLHGHPTRSPLLNELLATPALGLWFPYRRYRALHLRHHINERLTDPLDDPESWYLPASRWSELTGLQRRILQFNATLSGRLLIGPALSWAGFWREEIKLFKAQNPTVIRAWGLHCAGLIPVLVALAWADFPLWLYLLAVAYPATAIILLRSFIEHRAAVRWQSRTAIVESGKLMSLLYLNNNLHAVHHDNPSLPWYQLPAQWEHQRNEVLANNGGYHIKGGYGEVFRRWFFQRREPIAHPYPDALIKRPPAG
ncbi:MAG: fatty acid desaturase [Gammaproteobacteria bacterium]|nr:fatty acid desaturase [Gammaproteobacteria bacterium]